MYSFSRIDYKTVDKADYNNFENKTPFTTVEWLQFLKKYRKIEPLILRIGDTEGHLGYFSGGIMNILGFRVLGSPFYGWLCQHMGFDLKRDVNKSQLIDDLIDYVLKELKCGFILITDLKFSSDDLEQCKYKLIKGERYRTCYIDLTKSEEELFKAFKSGYRTCVRKFEKENCSIEQDYTETFIKEHYLQLKEVFAKNKLKAPNYEQKMRQLYDVLREKEMVLSIKALSPDNKNIASSYYIGFGDLAFFASNASYKSTLSYCPNQALMWYSMKHWKKKGMRIMDMGGGGDYKENFGGMWKITPTIMYSKNKTTYLLFVGLKRIYYKSLRWVGKYIDIIHDCRNLLSGKPLRRG